MAVLDPEAWRRSLPICPIPEFFTGLKLRPEDPRDWSMAAIPGVAAQLEAGVPESADLLRFIQGPPLNQGAVPSCVAHTMASMKSIHEQAQSGTWIVFNAPRAHNETGPLSEGRYPDTLLKYCLERGMPVANGETRYRIAGYAFAPPGAGWAETIKASIASGRPVALCMLLPSVFGWESGGTITQGYHEVLVVGYRPDAFLIRNSWGEGWGRNGLGWVPLSYLTQQNNQNGYCQAHTATDEGGPGPQPEPQPEPKPGKVVVTGTVTGGGLDLLKAGVVLQASGGGFSGSLMLTQVTREEPNPEPKPDPQPSGELSVTVSASGAVLQARAAYQGNPVPASFTGTVSGQALPIKFSSYRWPYTAVWGLSVAPRGEVTVTAVSGTKTGKVAQAF